MEGSSGDPGYWSLGSAIPGQLARSVNSDRWRPGVLVAGRYRLEASVGQGAHATVFRAQDLSLPRKVALKALGSLDEDEQARFLREARLMARLRHPALG